MKSIILTLITVLSIFQLANAQWTNISGTGNYYLNSGTVGIGTTNPTLATLQINGTGDFLSFSGNNTPTQFNTYNSSDFRIIQRSNAVMTFWTNTLERMRIDQNGNVGIGTTNPVNNLQIGTQTSTATATPVTMSFGATYSNTAGANPKLKLYDDGTAPYGFGISGSQMDAVVPAGANFAWYINGGQKMILNSAGNVGIGTSTVAAWAPAYKVIDTYGYGYLYGSSNGTGYSGTGYGQTSWGNNSYYDGTSHAIGTGAASYLLQGTGYLVFGNAPSVTAGSTQTFTERFRIDNNGNVGIGTSNTQGYTLAVNGTAIATSMTVKAYANWPDYVFKKNYTLPSLTEVKTYIDQNHHLPEIPSEQQIAKDGLNLGEMNKLLVKKVEELTLYLIEKDKKEKEQELRLQSQEERILKLEEAVLNLTKAGK